MILAAIRICLSRVVHGLGVLRQGHHFLLRQGPYTQTVSDRFGLTLYLLNWLTLTTVIVAMVLSVLVFGEYSSLRIDLVLTRNGLRRYAYVMRAAMAALLVSVLLLATSFH